MDYLVRWADDLDLLICFYDVRSYPCGAGLVHIPVARSLLEYPQASCGEIYQSLLPKYEIC